jgi:hypothetical protein
MNEDTVKKPIDRPWLVCDNSTSANTGLLYMTTKPPSWVPAPNRAYLKISTDSGITWSAYHYVDTTGYLTGNIIQSPMAAITTSANGALCLAYPSYLVSQSIFPKILFAKSANRGSNFTYTDLINNVLFFPDTNLKLGYCLAAHPTDSNKLAFAYVGGQNSDADIFVSSTNDGGATWHSPVRVNDDLINNGKHQDLVWASYNPAGTLAVTWRDRRNGTGSGFFQSCDTYGAVSHTNGTSFNPNFRLSTVTAPFDSVLMNDGNDFMSCRLVGDTIFATWSDVRNNKLNIYFAETSDSSGISSGMVEVATEDAIAFTVFPDPAAALVNVTLPLRLAESKLKVFNAKGGIVFEKVNPLATEVIDCRAFSPGMYLLVWLCGEYALSKKIVIGR